MAGWDEWDDAHTELVRRLLAMVGDDRPVHGVIECPACSRLSLCYGRDAEEDCLSVRCMTGSCEVRLRIDMAGPGPALPRFTEPIAAPLRVLEAGPTAMDCWLECRHFQGLVWDFECDADVAYEAVVDRSGRRPLYPCLRSDGVAGRCPRVSYRTTEEALEEAARLDVACDLEDGEWFGKYRKGPGLIEGR